MEKKMRSDNDQQHYNYHDYYLLFCLLSFYPIPDASIIYNTTNIYQQKKYSKRNSSSKSICLFRANVVELVLVLLLVITSIGCCSSATGTSFTNRQTHYYQWDENEYKNSKNGFWCGGLGRDFVVPITPRGGEEDTTTNPTTNKEASSLASSPLFVSADARTPPPTNNPSTTTTNTARKKSRTYRRYGGRSLPRSSLSSFSSSTTKRSTSTTNNNNNNWFQSAKEFLQKVNLPQIQVRAEPTTTLKLRKRFPFLKTVITLGADCNLQMGVWQFRSSWEDSFIGGSLTMAGRELQFNKAWLLSMGVGDLATRLRLRAAVDMGTFKAYIRLGFRSERLSPINLAEGFTVIKQLPLDGPQGHVKLEFKANVAVPQPEIEFSTENRKGSLIHGVGMGDVEVNIEELNLLLDY